MHINTTLKIKLKKNLIIYMIKYYPYKSDKPTKKYYIIINENKKVYFGQAGASDFTIHKDEARKQRYINRLEIIIYHIIIYG